MARAWFDYAVIREGASEAKAPAAARWGTWLVLALLAVKLVVTAWNCAVFDGKVYDEAGLHAPRARTGGLGLEGRVYNGPLYYLPAYPLAARQARELGGWPDAVATHEASSAAREDPRRVALDDQLLGRLRWTNLLHLALFYAAWLGVVFPTLIRDRWSRLCAALVLLALPGYQKLGAMVHPDAAMCSLTALAFAVFVALRVRRERPPSVAELTGLAALGGLAALARPFGLLTVLAATVGAMWLAWRTREGWLSWLRRCAVPVLVAAALTGAWPAYQIARLGQLAPIYSSTYTQRYAEARADFDYLAYFTRFYYVDLLRRPNRHVRAFDEDSDRFHNRYGNSFWTLLYSETWGDHWLHVSGPVGKETRAPAKRVALAVATPTIPWLGWRLGVGVAAVIAKLRKRAEDRDSWAMVLAFLVAGVGLYLHWHLSDGLTPGKNSSVKFIYNAYLAPFALLLCFSTPLRARTRKLALGFVLALFAATLPISIFVPSWL